jgi:hypothetical protein
LLGAVLGMTDRLVLSDAAWDRIAPLITGRPECTEKPIRVDDVNHLSWGNDRVSVLRPGRLGHSIQVEDKA